MGYAKSYGVDTKMVTLLQKIYEKSQSAVRIGKAFDDAEQLLEVPILIAEQVQVQLAGSACTAEEVPERHRLLVGALVNVCPLEEPHARRPLP